MSWFMALLIHASFTHTPVVNVDTFHLELSHVVGDAIAQRAAGGQAVLVADDLPELNTTQSNI